MPRYKLPSGEYTEDPDVYAQEYEDLANEVLKYFPGFIWEGISSNYGLTFAYLESYESDRREYFYEFTLSIAACRSLLFGELPERVKRFDL